MLFLVFHEVRIERGRKETDLILVTAPNKEEAIQKAKQQFPERGKWDNYSAHATSETKDKDVVLLFRNYE